MAEIKKTFLFLFASLSLTLSATLPLLAVNDAAATADSLVTEEHVTAVDSMAVGHADLHTEEAHTNAEHDGHEAEGGFNAGEMIMHHIADAHSIHMIGHLAIPLPIILYTDNGIELFSSSKFVDEHHNPVAYTSPKTGYTYENLHEVIHRTDGAGNYQDANTDEYLYAQPMDFSITKSTAGMFFVIILMLIIFGAVAKGSKQRKGQAPKGIQNALEPFILFIRDELAIPSIGSKEKAEKFMPFLLTTFFFIWMCNMLGLIPFLGGFNITGTMSVTIVLATVVFIITAINGNKHYYGHLLWPPGVPLPIKFILVPIEILGIFIKPTVLMIRLTANITAGHIIILAFVSLVLMFGQTSAIAGYGVGIGATAFMIFMFFIELLVAFLQAYVFTLLAALYFGDATQDAHH